VGTYLLGRKLMKAAEMALAEAAPAGGTLPAGVRMVLVDVAENPDSSIGEVAARTGFPQSHVSASVARLRDAGALVTEADARDGRRTLVRVSKELRAHNARRSQVPIEAALERELGGEDADVAAVVELLNALAERLIPGVAGVAGEGSAR